MQTDRIEQETKKYEECVKYGSHCKSDISVVVN